MKATLSRRLVLLAALAAPLALGLAGPAAAGTRSFAADSVATAVVREVNAARAAHGLRPLAVRLPLVRAGRAHVQDMARHAYFAHEWSTGASFSRWIRRYWPGRAYRRTWSAGENLYWSGPTIAAPQVVKAWLRSPGHRRNLLEPRWRAIGVGAVAMLAPVGAFAGVDRATVVAAEFGVRT